jgi:hypothetical protein
MGRGREFELKELKDEQRNLFLIDQRFRGFEES